MTDALLTITVGLLEEPASVAERVLAPSSDAHSRDGLARLARELGMLASRDHKVLARVDSCTRGAAAGSVVLDISDGTAGDRLFISVPGYPRQTISIVASGAVAANGEINAGSNDTTAGDELVAAIRANPTLHQHLSAVNTTGTVALTARYPGSWAHDVLLTKDESDGGTFTLTQLTGGDDLLDQPTMDIVFGTPDITANDTISIGARTYTWKASASADGEITLSTTPATAATNFAAAVNADTNLAGICTASVDTATVTLTFVCDPRLAQHIVVAYTESNAGSVVPAGTVVGVTGAEAPLIGTTVTGSSTTRTYGGRGIA